MNSLHYTFSPDRCPALTSSCFPAWVSKSPEDGVFILGNVQVSVEVKLV